MPTRSLYAVLAGINEYRSPVTPLEGCLQDVNNWHDYLNNESSSFNLNIQVLKNTEVTKNALASALQNALTQASVSDVVFFFYSGHGTRESADPVFADIEQDNALESLVCYDSVVDHNGSLVYNLLSDKEIHYIISQYGKEGTHIIMVFDCCHSGGITRNAFPDRDGICVERRYIPSERDNFIAPMRTWNQFLFGEHISRDEVAKIGWLKRVMQNPHITLSACQNDESAYEQSGRGIFTSNLIDVLRRSRGSLSYYDLQSRTRLFTQNQFRQTPEIYTIRNHEDDLLRIFLDKTTPHSDLGCTVYYKNFTGWVMDLGAIHGITAYSGPVIIQLDENKYELSIREVFSNHTRLELPDGLENLLVREQAYTASVKNHFSGNTSFFIEPGHIENDVCTQLKADAEIWILEHDAPFSITDTRAHSSYVLNKTSDKLFICQNDDSTRPATELSLNDADRVSRAILYMRHIAQWEYVRSLCNPEFHSEEYPVTMQFFKVNSDLTKHELYARGDTFEFNYDKTSIGEWTGKLKVSLTNRSKVKYYCSLLYLSNLFQIYGNMLDGKVIGLSPGETTWINNGDVVELDLEPYIVDFNYEYSIFYLKLLAGTKLFQVETLEQSPLPAPSLRSKKGDGDSAVRGLKTRTEKAEKNVNWFTGTICFKGRNPHYSSS